MNVPIGLLPGTSGSRQITQGKETSDGEGGREGLESQRVEGDGTA